MKKYIISALILVIYIAFSIFILIKNRQFSVIKIITPATIQVDMNQNKIAENNETICIPNIIVPSVSFFDEKPEFLKEYNQTDIVKLGYLANEFAHSILDQKNIKLKFTGEKTTNCRYAEVYVDKIAYSDILLNNGFAEKEGQVNKKQINNNLSKDLDLVIYNLKSNKYHTLDCEYGRISSDQSIIKKTQLPKDASPCKFCHVKHKSHTNNNSAISKTKLSMQNAFINLVISDYTQILKPNYNCTSQICKLLEKEINNAKESIDIACYTWDQNKKIMEALTKAHERGVKIRVVYDSSTKSSEENTRAIEKLLLISNQSNTDYRKNHNSFTDKLMHNKFMIFDSKTVATGSMNYTNTGLSEFNGNVILIIKSKEIANLYKLEFEQMLNGNFHEKKSPLNRQNKFEVGDTKINIYFSPYDKTTKHIIPLIDNAQKYIYIPAFVITHEKISQALINAKNRGIDVKIIIDANNASSLHSKIPFLRQSKIPVKTENYAGKLHSKTMIIDDKYLIIGSMNFSNSGENINDENLLILENSKFTNFYKNYFLYLWRKIDDKWLHSSAHSEGNDSIGSCFDGIDNDYDGKIDMEDSGCKVLTH